MIDAVFRVDELQEERPAPDRKLVVRALECCVMRHRNDALRCIECPYKDPEHFCLNNLKRDALTLLQVDH